MRLWLMVLALVMALPAAVHAQAYRLKPGDSVSVTVWQDSKLDRQVVVAPDGSVSFPLAGHIQAGGMTLPGLEAELRSRLRGNYNTDLDVTVALAALPDRKESERTIYITGEVNRPGPYPLAAPTNVFQALALSGGFSPFAATSRIEIYRRIDGQDAKVVFNYRDFQSGRDLSGNIDLRAGDVVVVPEKGLFEH